MQLQTYAKTFQAGRSPVFALLFFFCFAGVAQATLLVFEPFDYPTGPLSGNGGTGFDGAWRGIGQGAVQTGSLAVGNYQGAYNSLRSGRSDIRNLDTIYGADGTELWVSFLINIESQVTFPFATKWSGLLIGPNLFVGLPSSPAGTTLTTWGMDTASQPGKFMSQVPFVLGTPALLVVHMTFLPLSDQIDLYINPTTAVPPLVVDASRSDLDLTQDMQLAIVGFSVTGSTATFDELRMGTTYADVVPVPVPEPISFSLAITGFIGSSWFVFRSKSRNCC